MSGRGRSVKTTREDQLRALNNLHAWTYDNASLLDHSVATAWSDMSPSQPQPSQGPAGSGALSSRLAPPRINLSSVPCPFSVSLAPAQSTVVPTQTGDSSDGGESLSAAGLFIFM
jgi:hypothetical protein